MSTRCYRHKMSSSSAQALKVREIILVLFRLSMESGLKTLYQRTPCSRPHPAQETVQPFSPASDRCHCQVTTTCQLFCYCFPKWKCSPSPNASLNFSLNLNCNSPSYAIFSRLVALPFAVTFAAGAIAGISEILTFYPLGELGLISVLNSLLKIVRKMSYVQSRREDQIFHLSNNL